MGFLAHRPLSVEPNRPFLVNPFFLKKKLPPKKVQLSCLPGTAARQTATAICQPPAGIPPPFPGVPPPPASREAERGQHALLLDRTGEQDEDDMGRLQHHHRSRSASSFARSSETTIADLDVRSLGSTAVAAETVECPFGNVDGLSRAELREAAYEVFFMSCRAAGGKGGGGAGLNYYQSGGDGGGGDGGSPTIGSGPRGGTGMNVVSSRVKRALGLKARRSSQPTVRSSMNSSSAPGSPGRMRSARDRDQAPGSPGKTRRPMTSAEIMRQQMRVPEQSDARLRKTLMRTLVGQVRHRPSVHTLCMVQAPPLMRVDRIGMHARLKG